ncbi:MAG TPA: CopD family protein, partial [Geminicoccaceae bacterium]|nr:CopD family protein [Geminicoccaceae bacterium]
RGAAVVAAAGAALALSSLAMSGHAVTAGPAWVTVPAVLAHVACVAFWIGSLWPLRRAIGERGAAAAPAVRRFSLIAVPAVLVLAGAGVVIAALQVRTPGALVDTGYGRLLLAKLALVAGLLLLAALNKLRLTPALARGEARAATALRRSIAAETGLAAAILVATGLLGTTPPPRALAGHAAADHAATAHGASGHAGHHAHHAGGAAGPVVERASVADPAGREATIEVAPAGRAGAAAVAVALARPDGTPLRPIEVTVSLSNRAAGIEPISRGAAETGPGAYRVDGLVLAPGPWTVRVEALVDDFEKAVFEAAVEIR